MARFEIDKARVRNRLDARREPYWGAPIARGLFIGFRKLEQGGTWIARLRDEDGKQRYQSIGHADSTPYDDAVKAAHTWAKQIHAGVDTSEVQTVADACKAYVKDRRREVGDANADDAEGRFMRTVYEHSLGKVKLAKLRTEQIKDWRAELDMADSSKNRTLTALKAALNFAVRSRYVGADKAVEWEGVEPYEVNSRRDLYLDRAQRHALVAELAGQAVPFVRALCLMPLRPGALASMTVAEFNARRASLHVVTDKANAGRDVVLFPDALALFRGQAKGKLPAAPLIAYDDGSHWTRWDWNDEIKAAAKAAGLPAATCAYTLRHSVITDMLVGGMDTLTVARMAGTSIAMIEKHYGKLLQGHASEAMAALAL